MATIARFKLPDVGEGLTEAELLHWAVAEGDTVDVNQILCEVETAKSAVELPSPVAGVIDALHVREGETVTVGSVIVTLRVGASPAEDADDHSLVLHAPQSARTLEAELTSSRTPPGLQPVGEQVDSAEQEAKVLVGTGPSALAPRSRHLRPRSEMPDLKHATTQNRVPIRGVRKAVAAAMTTSAFTAPHVTEWLAADVTETMELVRALRDNQRWSGIRVNPMLFVAKALLIAIERHPGVNTRWDEVNQEIIYYEYVNLGIAAATPRGLIVPNVKNAGALALSELASALGELVDTARAGKTTPAQMSGGTITITNIGALGIDAGTPILNPGEAAILAFGAVRPTPWVIDGQITIRQVAQMALSFDHRLVDGELGSNVLTTIASVLSNPVAELLHAPSKRN